MRRREEKAAEEGKFGVRGDGPTTGRVRERRRGPSEPLDEMHADDGGG